MTGFLSFIVIASAGHTLSHSRQPIHFEEISFDIANNQLTSKPDYEYTSETKTVYATEEINVYNLPDKNTQEIVFSISFSFPGFVVLVSLFVTLLGDSVTTVC